MHHGVAWLKAMRWVVWTVLAFDPACPCTNTATLAELQGRFYTPVLTDAAMVCDEGDAPTVIWYSRRFTVDDAQQ